MTNNIFAGLKTKHDVDNFISDFDSNIAPGSEDYLALAYLISAAAKNSTAYADISTLCDISLLKAAEFTINLQASGVFTPEGIVSNWTRQPDTDDSGIELLLCAAIATGLLQRITATDGTYTYQNTEMGMKRAAELIKRMAKK